MPVDTSIYGQVGRTSRIQSPLEQQNALSQVLQGVNQNRMAEMKMQEMQSAQDKQNRLSALLAGEYKAPEDRESALMRGGFAGEAQDMTKNRLAAGQTQATTQKTLADAEKQKLATAIEKIGAVGQLLGGVRDQGTYDQARAQAQAMGLDVSNMPPQFDPALVEQKRAQSLSMEQQLAQVWKQKGFDLDVEKFGETKRSNLAGEGLQRRGQDITVRGQNMTDARSRESTAATMTKPFEITGEDGKPVLVQQDKQGNIRPVSGYGPKQGASKPLTEGQSKALLFGSRMQSANEIFDELASKGVNVSVPGSRTPVIGAAINAFQPADRQRLDQAKRDFLNAVLRRESGAVIAKEEFDNGDQQYFPQPGDRPEVIAQKKANRETAMRGITAEVPDSENRIRQVRGDSAPKPAAPVGFKILSVE